MSDSSRRALTLTILLVAGFMFLLTTKITGAHDLSWFVVTFPLWVIPVIFINIFGAIIVLVVLIAVMDWIFDINGKRALNKKIQAQSRRKKVKQNGQRTVIHNRGRRSGK